MNGMSLATRNNRACPEAEASAMSACWLVGLFCCAWMLVSCDDSPRSGFAGLAGRVTFDSSRRWGVQIFEMDLRSGATRQLTSAWKDGRVNRVPEFSRDGTRIAFVSMRDGNEEIYVMHADGSH